MCYCDLADLLAIRNKQQIYFFDRCSFSCGIDSNVLKSSSFENKQTNRNHLLALQMIMWRYQIMLMDCSKETFSLAHFSFNSRFNMVIPYARVLHRIQLSTEHSTGVLYI